MHKKQKYSSHYILKNVQNVRNNDQIVRNNDQIVKPAIEKKIAYKIERKLNPK